MTNPRTPWAREFLEARALAKHLSDALESIVAAERISRHTLPGVAYECHRVLTQVGTAGKMALAALRRMEREHVVQPDLLNEIDALETDVNTRIEDWQRRLEAQFSTREGTLKDGEQEEKDPAQG